MSPTCTPSSLRHCAVLLAYGAHQGVVKSKNWLGSKVGFPSLDQQVEEVFCQASRQPDPPVLVIIEDGPTTPWQRVSADFGSLPDGSHLLIVMEDYSWYPEVETVSITSAGQVIPKVEKMMATHGHGLFGEIHTDNEPLFTSHDWAELLQSQNRKHQRPTPW
ncbi:hypothetical protein NDU88_004462 [Pleurodeles waltl]|uniref:Integrase catalytic domain-containing protein n=1 Tax=Pleurodeles waltl TaxID=8319 RepID=A0AAV7WWM8_PLEWA|nr:hypothetical protein NDU88_004462 [Pleurodeles waltl]